MYKNVWCGVMCSPTKWRYTGIKKCYLTCPLLYADSRSLQVGGLGVHGCVVKSVWAQAIKTVIALRASDSDLLSSLLGGLRTEMKRGQCRFKIQ